MNNVPRVLSGWSSVNIFYKMGKGRGDEKEKSNNTCCSYCSCIAYVILITVLIWGIVLWNVNNTRVDRINE